MKIASFSLPCALYAIFSRRKEFPLLFGWFGSLFSRELFFSHVKVAPSLPLCCCPTLLPQAVVHHSEYNRRRLQTISVSQLMVTLPQTSRGRLTAVFYFLLFLFYADKSAEAAAALKPHEWILIRRGYCTEYNNCPFLYPNHVHNYRMETVISVLLK